MSDFDLRDGRLGAVVGRWCYLGWPNGASILDCSSYAFHPARWGASGTENFDRIRAAFCCGNSPLGPQRRIAAAQAQIDSNPALHGLARGVLRLPTDRVEIQVVFQRWCSGHSGVIRWSFGGIRILLREFGSLGIFCDVAVHMTGAL